MVDKRLHVFVTCSKRRLINCFFLLQKMFQRFFLKIRLTLDNKLGGLDG